MTTPVYVQQTFNSFEEFNSFPNGWDTEFREVGLETGPLQIETLASGKLLLNTAEFGQPTIQQGSTPTGMRTFALPARLEGGATWLNRQLSPTTLMLFPLSGELFCAATGAMKMATVSIEEQLFDDLSRSMTDGHDARLGAGELFETDTERWRTLHRNMVFFARFSRHYGDLDELAGWRDYFEEELAQSLVACFADERRALSVVSASSAAVNVRRAVRYMLAHLSDPLKISDLCAELSVSRRCLESSFARALGVSPKQFLLELRFTRCHAELEGASPDSTSVSAVANRWGIWHLGEFARVYRERYGEQPSQTLARVP